MKYLLLFLSIIASAATVTVCSSGCTTNNLQTALDSIAACGDTIQIKSTETQTGTFTISYRGCTAMTPITVTSDRAVWLPTSGARVTPSHLANMAQLVTNTGAGPALADHLDVMNRPPAHWIFVGIAFSTSAFGFDIVGFNGAGTAANASQISDDITFDRCYFYMPSVYAATAASNALRGDITNLVVKNSFFGDSFRSGQESHAISVLTNNGPITVTNNFITTMSIPVFTGGGDPSYSPGSYLANGGTVNYNYFWRPWKYNSDPGQPHYSDYTTAQASGGGYVVCNKNLGELKWGIGVTWQYNVGENAWFNAQCMNQFVSFTDTLRTNYDVISTTPSLGTVTMTDSTHITWTGGYRIGNTGTGACCGIVTDLGLCLNTAAASSTECRQIASFSGNTLVVASPFSSAPGGARTGAISYAASAQLTGLTLSHNVWKNADQAISILPLSPSNGISNAGFGINHTISQNLWVVNISYIGPHSKGIVLEAGEENYNFSPSGYIVDHNTLYNPNGIGGAFVYVEGNGFSIPLFAMSAITNNLFGVSASGGNGPFSGDGSPSIGDVAANYFATSNIKNNGIPGASLGPGAGAGNVISGNQLQAWVDPFGGLSSSGIFTVVPSSPYYHAGTDGASLGTDFIQLPMITGLQVAANPSSSATVLFSVNPGINDIKNTQPCVLEVSSSRNLLSDLGTYSVIANLDPTLTIGADLSTKSSVTISSNNVTWPITGLSIGTTYYGRLMCYGDTEFFTFTTSLGPTPTISIKGTVHL